MYDLLDLELSSDIPLHSWVVYQRLQVLLSTGCSRAGIPPIYFEWYLRKRIVLHYTSGFKSHFLFLLSAEHSYSEICRFLKISSEGGSSLQYFSCKTRWGIIPITWAYISALLGPHCKYGYWPPSRIILLRNNVVHIADLKGGRKLLVFQLAILWGIIPSHFHQCYHQPGAYLNIF